MTNRMNYGPWEDEEWGTHGTTKPKVNPNEILHNMLDHIHDGNREELVGQMILMLGWLHQGGTMPNISKDTVTNTTLWIIPQND